MSLVVEMVQHKVVEFWQEDKEGNTKIVCNSQATK
jgi:hypothetical protein